MAIFSSKQNDNFLGSFKNDIFVSSFGNDTFDGSSGFDIVDYSNLGQAITILPQGVISKGSFGVDQIFNFEVIIGGQGQANTIDASSGSGQAFLDIDLRVNRLSIGNIPRIGSLTFEVVNFVDVVGSINSDNIIGNGFNNIINGFGGNDFIAGYDGDDILIGSFGNDIIAGDFGNDIIFGADQFSVGDGEFDVLGGGANSDVFGLGNNFGSFYKYNGNLDYALIADFSNEDKILLGAGETYFVNPDADGFDVFVARGKTFDLIADVYAAGFLNQKIPTGAFALTSGQSFGAFISA